MLCELGSEELWHTTTLNKEERKNGRGTYLQNIVKLMIIKIIIHKFCSFNTIMLYTN